MFQKGGFAGAGLADDMEVVQAIGRGQAERHFARERVSGSELCECACIHISKSAPSPRGMFKWELPEHYAMLTIFPKHYLNHEVYL